MIFLFLSFFLSSSIVRPYLPSTFPSPPPNQIPQSQGTVHLIISSPAVALLLIISLPFSKPVANTQFFHLPPCGPGKRPPPIISLSGAPAPEGLLYLDDGTSSLSNLQTVVVSFLCPTCRRPPQPHIHIRRRPSSPASARHGLTSPFRQYPEKRLRCRWLPGAAAA